MIRLITGGSCSGKSAYAEKLVSQSGSGDRFYLATMAANDEESKKRITRHRKAREGMDFTTLEYPVNVAESVEYISEKAIVLLECVSNLVANEMFMEEAKYSLYKSVLRNNQVFANDYSKERSTYIQLVSLKLAGDILKIASKVKDMVIVTNNIFEDGQHYDDDTLIYIEVIGAVNQKLAAMVDEVTEVVAGIPIAIK